MNKRIKKLWVEALRSDEYEQGKGTLRQLGNEKDYVEKIRCDEQGVQRFPQRDVTTETTRRWAGLDDLPDGHSLAELNDNGLSFKRIADRIERYL